MTRTTRKLVAFIVGVAFALFAFGTLAWATSGFRNWNAAMWFDCWGKGTPQEVSKTEHEKPEANGSMRKDTAKAGLVYDSDASSTTLSIVKPSPPLYKRTAEGVAFYANGTSFDGLTLSLSARYCNGGEGLDQTVYNLVSLNDNQSDYVVVTYDKLAGILSSNITKYNMSTQNNSVTVLARILNSDGIASDWTSITFKRYTSVFNGVCLPSKYEYRFNGTKLIISHTNASMEPLGSNLKIGIFPTSAELPVTVLNDTYLNSVQDCYFGENTEAISRNGSDYEINLAALSFSHELHDVCTVLAMPYCWNAGDEWDVLGYVEPIHFSITKLAAPSNIRIQDGNLTWSGVSGAEGYSVFCGTENFTVTETSIALSKFTNLVDGENTFRVRALGNVGTSLAKMGKATAFNASSVITQVVTLTYNIDGDTVTKFVPFGKSVGDYLYNVTVDGREFGGWYYDSGYSSAVNSQDKLENDTTIYARLSDKPVTERPLTWWERNMWFVLAPCIAVAGLALVIGIALSIKKKKS